MRRSMLLAVVAAVVLSLVAVGVVAGGKPARLPRVGSLTTSQGIDYVSNIDASFNDVSGHPSVFIQTNSTHRECLATINEEATNVGQLSVPIISQLVCAQRSMVIGGQLVQGIWLLLNLGSVSLGVGQGYYNVSVYQEGAEGYGAPLLWVPPAP